MACIKSSSFVILQDYNGYRQPVGQFGSNASDITAAIFSGEQSHSVDEGIAESPLLHSSLTSTLFETLVHL